MGVSAIFDEFKTKFVTFKKLSKSGFRALKPSVWL